MRSQHPEETKATVSRKDAIPAEDEKEKSGIEERELSYIQTVRRLDAHDSFMSETKKGTDTKLTPSEHASVIARKTWSDVISATDKYLDSLEDTSKEKVIQRLRSFGYSNPEKVLADIIKYLQEKALISVRMNADFLKSPGLDQFETGNMFERKTDRDGYREKREQTEQALFDYLPPELKEVLLKDPKARPRYGALGLPDANHPIVETEGGAYGDSFILLRNIAKLNCLFTPSDSYNFFDPEAKPSSYIPCTFSHLEMLLRQCTDDKLKALADRVTIGTLSGNYSFAGSAEDGYIEVQLFPVSFFDRNMVQHIHIEKVGDKPQSKFIDVNKYTLTDVERKSLDGLRTKDTEDPTQVGITVTNLAGNPYTELHQNFIKFVAEGKMREAEHLLFQYPALIVSSDGRGWEAIHIATENGRSDMIPLFLKYGAKIDDPTPQGKTIKDIAEESKKQLNPVVAALYDKVILEKKLEFVFNSKLKEIMPRIKEIKSNDPHFITKLSEIKELFYGIKNNPNNCAIIFGKMIIERESGTKASKSDVGLFKEVEQTEFSKFIDSILTSFHHTPEQEASLVEQFKKYQAESLIPPATPT